MADWRLHVALPYAWLIGAWAEARPSRHSAHTNAEGLTRLGKALRLEVCCGGVLLSHNPSVAVPLALPGLASRFGMEAGRVPGAMTTTRLVCSTLSHGVGGGVG